MTTADPPPVVLDASFVVAAIGNEARAAAARRALAAQAGRLIAPDLLGFEAVNAFIRKRRTDAWPAERVVAAIEMLLDLPVSFHPLAPLLDRSIALALDAAHSIYDCSYVALAEREGATLATLDARLAALAARAGVAVMAPA